MPHTRLLRKSSLFIPALSYDLVRGNCNHFSSAFAEALGVSLPPAWINRLAWLGSTFPCLDPRFALQLLQPPTQQTLEAPPQQRPRVSSQAQPVYARALDAEPRLGTVLPIIN
jgi:hypothetical protein